MFMELSKCFTKIYFLGILLQLSPWRENKNQALLQRHMWRNSSGTDGCAMWWISFCSRCSKMKETTSYLGYCKTFLSWKGSWKLLQPPKSSASWFAQLVFGRLKTWCSNCIHCGLSHTTTMPSLLVYNALVCRLCWCLHKPEWKNGKV